MRRGPDRASLVFLRYDLTFLSQILPDFFAYFARNILPVPRNAQIADLFLIVTHFIFWLNYVTLCTGGFTDGCWRQFW
jgi:hypothetical protein